VPRLASGRHASFDPTRQTPASIRSSCPVSPGRPGSRHESPAATKRGSKAAVSPHKPIMETASLRRRQLIQCILDREGQIVREPLAYCWSLVYWRSLAARVAGTTLGRGQQGRVHGQASGQALNEKTPLILPVDQRRLVRESLRTRKERKNSGTAGATIASRTVTQARSTDESPSSERSRDPSCPRTQRSSSPMLARRYARPSGSALAR